VVEAFGACCGDRTDPAIAEILFDVRVRGDRTGASRALIQRFVSRSDLQGFTRAKARRRNWTDLPSDRIEQQRDILARTLRPPRSAESAARTRQHIRPALPAQR
jgi:hypothetical protein